MNGIRSLFIISLVFVATLATPVNDDKRFKHCRRSIPLIYLPLCGYDGEQLKTFSNEYRFEYENCMSNGRWIRLRCGRCKDIPIYGTPIPFNNDCPKICHADYSPVCGTDGKKIKTYGNLCSFKAANCKANFGLRLLKVGEC